MSNLYNSNVGCIYIGQSRHYACYFFVAFSGLCVVCRVYNCVWFSFVSIMERIPDAHRIRQGRVTSTAFLRQERQAKQRAKCSQRGAIWDAVTTTITCFIISWRPPRNVSVAYVWWSCGDSYIVHFDTIDLDMREHFDNVISNPIKIFGTCDGYVL